MQSAECRVWSLECSWWILEGNGVDRRVQSGVGRRGWLGMGRTQWGATGQGCTHTGLHYGWGGQGSGTCGQKGGRAATNAPPRLTEECSPPPTSLICLHPTSICELYAAPDQLLWCMCTLHPSLSLLQTLLPTFWVFCRPHQLLWFVCTLHPCLSCL